MMLSLWDVRFREFAGKKNPNETYKVLDISSRMKRVISL